VYVVCVCVVCVWCVGVWCVCDVYVWCVLYVTLTLNNTYSAIITVRLNSVIGVTKHVCVWV
jgi:hypothetical protein